MTDNLETSGKPAWLPSNVYDVLKWVALIALPAFGTFYFTLAPLWNLPAANQVAGTTLALTTLLGALLGLATANYNKSDSKFAGTLVISNASNPEIPTNYNFKVGDLDALETKGEVTLKVNNTDPAV